MYMLFSYSVIDLEGILDLSEGNLILYDIVRKHTIFLSLPESLEGNDFGEAGLLKYNTKYSAGISLVIIWP